MAPIDILSTLNKSGSGINLKDLTGSLVDAATAAPKAAAQAQIDHADVAISSLGTLRAQMSGFASSLNSLAATDALGVTSTSAGVQAKITDRTAVTTAHNQIEVLQLAQAQVLEFAGYASRDAALPAGQLKLEFGAWYTPDGGTETFAQKPGSSSVTINVTEGMTLDELARSLSKVTGLSAAVIDKGDGTFSLGIAGSSGAGNALRITATETVAGSGLAAFDTTARNADVQVQAAQNAVLTLNGVTLQRESNTVSGAIDGIELTLTARGSISTVAIGRSASVAETNISTLVTQLNATRSMLAEMSLRATADSKAGPLPGDAALRQITQGLESLLRSPITGYGDKALHLSDFGVRTGQDGSFYLDRPAFTKAFAANPESFDAVFADRLDGEGVEFSGPVPPTFLPGSYSFRRDTTTGTATLDGRALAGVDLGDGRFAYTAETGPSAGMIFTVSSDLTTTQINRGRSFLSQLSDTIAAATSVGGTLDTAVDRYANEVEDAQTALDKVVSHAQALQTLYTQRFSAMETAVSRFHSTSAYLDSMVAQWNKKE